MSPHLGWLGVPAFGLTWCLCSWVVLVSPLLGWPGVPAPGLSWCPRTYSRLCKDRLPTWWRHLLLAKLVMATPLVDCLKIFCRLGDHNSFGQLGDDLFSTWWRQPLWSTWWRQSPSCRLGDSNPFSQLCNDLLSTWWWQPLPGHCVLTRYPLPPSVDIMSPLLQSLSGLYDNFRPYVDVGSTTAYCIDCLSSLCLLQNHPAGLGDHGYGCCSHSLRPMGDYHSASLYSTFELGRIPWFWAWMESLDPGCWGQAWSWAGFG